MSEFQFNHIIKKGALAAWCCINGEMGTTFKRHCMHCLWTQRVIILHIKTSRFSGVLCCLCILHYIHESITLCPKNAYSLLCLVRLVFIMSSMLINPFCSYMFLGAASTPGGHITNRNWPLSLHNGCAVEVWEWISNFIPHFITDILTNSC